MANDIKGITVEIGGDTTNLKKALEDVNKSAAATTKELTQINRQLKYDPSNTTLLAQKHELLGSKIKDTKDKLETLKVAQEQFDQEALKTEEGAEQWRALQREIEKTEGQLKNLKKEYAETNGAAVALNNIGGALKGVGDKMTQTGESMTKNVTGPIVAGATAAVAAFNEVDSGMDIIVKKTGQSGDALKDMQDRAKHLAETIPTDFDTAGAAVGEVNTRFQLTGQALEDLSGKFIKFAELNDTDVSTSIDQTQKAMAAFNVDTKDAGGFLDLLTVQAQRTGIDMNTLLTSMTTNAAALSEMGLQADGAAVFLADLEVSGIDSSAALTGLKKALSNAAKEGKPMDQALKEVQESMANAKTEQEGMQAAMELFGNKAGPAIYKACKDGQLSFDELTGSTYDFTESMGAVDDTFADTLDPIDGFKTLLNTLKSTLAEVAVPIQEALAPMMERLKEIIKDVAERIKNMDPDTMNMIVRIAGIAAAIGPLLIVVGKLISSIGSISMGIGAIIANPIPALIAAAVAAIAFAVYEIVKHWEEIKAWFTAFKDALVEMFGMIGEWFSEKFTAAKEAVLNAWNGVVEFFVGIKDGVVDAWNNMVNSIVNFVTNIYTTLSNAWDNLRNATVNKWNQIKQGIVDAVTNTVNRIGEFPSRFMEKARQIADRFVEGIRNLRSNFTESIRNGIQGGLDYISSLPSRFYTWGVDMLQNLIDGIWHMVGRVADAAANVASRIASFLHFSVPDEGPLASFEEWMPDFMGGLADGIRKNKGVVIDEIKSLAADMSPNLEFDVSNAGLAGAPGAYGTGAGNVVNVGDLNITVVQREGQSGTMLARELSQKLAFEIQKQEVTWK